MKLRRWREESRKIPGAMPQAGYETAPLAQQITQDSWGDAPGWYETAPLAQQITQDSWGDAPGWYEAAPLARHARAAAGAHGISRIPVAGATG
jgi:hypothetical protein